jgi:hypothetical protein
MDAGFWYRTPTSVLNVLNPPLRYRSIGIAAAQAIAFTTTDPGASLPPWTLQSNPRRCVVDTDGPRPLSIRFDIFHSTLQAPIATGAKHGQNDPNAQTDDNSRSKSSARAALTARPSPRACIVADRLPLTILTSLPELIGGPRLGATVRASRVLNPPLRDRSIGIAAAQAIAFTTTDPGARTPPWTLQSNPRRCVVDTDGPDEYEGELSSFNGNTC